MTLTSIDGHLATLGRLVGPALVQDLEDSVSSNTWRAYRADLADYATVKPQPS